ncbi:MAG: hypothetical protein LBD41_06410 [Clostridiales Family XIII bacterium]|jgi:hypothetical protein|nr:hypothetical protein [Clostridiales Family XIII bacterium]
MIIFTIALFLFFAFSLFELLPFLIYKGVSSFPSFFCYIKQNDNGIKKNKFVQVFTVREFLSFHKNRKKMNYLEIKNYIYKTFICSLLMLPHSEPCLIITHGKMLKLINDLPGLHITSQVKVKKKRLIIEKFMFFGFRALNKNNWNEKVDFWKVEFVLENRFISLNEIA